MKSKEMEKFLEDLSGRSTALKEKRCINPPLGCGKPIEGFRDVLSEKEYEISGLCQKCQDEAFGY